MIDQITASVPEPCQAGLDLSTPGSDQWLDDLADGLTEHGWMIQDVSVLLTPSLLKGLSSEVRIVGY